MFVATHLIGFMANSAVTIPGIGTASGTGTATGAGQIIRPGVGSASGLGVATATGLGLDASFSSVVLLLGGDGADGATTTTDERPGTPNTISFFGDAQVDTAQSKFGTGSYLFDGTGDYLSMPHSTDHNLTTIFTVECWVRFNGLNYSVFLSKWPSTLGLNEWSFSWASNVLSFFIYRSNTVTQVSGAWTPTTGVWYHVCADRDASGHTRVYADGTMVGKNTTVTGTLNASNVIGVNIGRHPGDNNGFLNGWMDEIRITKGVARYASDSGYTVPTTAFPRS